MLQIPLFQFVGNQLVGCFGGLLNGCCCGGGGGGVLYTHVMVPQDVTRRLQMKRINANEKE